MRYSTFNKQASLIKTKLTQLDAQINTLTSIETLSPAQVAKAQSINKIAQSKHDEFENLLIKLFDSDPLPDDINNEEISQLQETITDLFINITSSCSIIIKLPSDTTSQSTNSSQSVVSSNGNSNSESLLRLPRLNLGTFEGQPSTWVAFYNLFENSVHNNTSINAVEKFTYLLTCLKGEPLNIIKSLPLTSANYEIAWTQLVKRYNNPRLLTSHHINNILDLPSMNQSSVKQLRNFVNEFQENSNALNALNYDVCSESLFLTAYILRKFDQEFRTRFEQSRKDSQAVPTITELLEFTEKQCVQLEAANLTQTASKSHNTVTSNTEKHQKPYQNHFFQKKVLLAASNNQPLGLLHCPYCDSSEHNIYNCHEFVNLSPSERLKFVQKSPLCTNCLRKHNVKSCTSHRLCNVCNKRHHSLLHLQFFQKPFSSESSSFTDAQPKQSSVVSDNQIKRPISAHHQTKNTTNVKSHNCTNSVMVGISQSDKNTILLATALVQLQTNNGYSVVVRAVLDSAAQHSFITESCAQRLNVSRQRLSSDISGISSFSVKTKGMCHINISSISGHDLAKAHPFLILDKITNNLPQQQVPYQIKDRLRHIMLADPTFDTPSPVDALIGADLFAYSLLNDSFHLGNEMPTALNTIFGYVLIGSSPVIQSQCQLNHSTSLLTTTDFDLHNMIQKFWIQENVPCASKLSFAEQECDTHFQTTHVRLNDGKYQVRLPFKEDPLSLGDSSQKALRVFQSLEHKLSSNPTFRNKYIDFMKDYKTSGHMTEYVSTDNVVKPNFFLPHHGILRNDKFRVVFNASAVTSTGKSLNDILHQGPKLHNSITDILLKFRHHKFVFVCDIRQMFRNIWVHDEDQMFQLIYWRESPDSPLKVYKLKTVTYGMSPSPFLALKVVQQLLEDESTSHPTATAALRDNIYVDDALLGCNTEEEALDLQQEVIQLMNKGGFELRKWLSNSPKLLEVIPEDHRSSPLLFQSDDPQICSVLGLKWFPEADVFSYAVTNIDNQLTKRSVLSVIARLYDPMGWLSPVIFWAKAFMQLLWTKCLQWDDLLPVDLSQIWSQFVKETQMLSNVKVPRYVCSSETTKVELHGYCDASESGFCACVYLRVTQENGNVQVHLLIAKSRVAPLKRVSLPRLELCGAQLLAKLLQYTFTQYSKITTINQIYGWCDSTIALSWILTPPYRLKTYVANRVAEIQESTCPINWRHVPSVQNPADCGSRGILPSQIIDHPLWWKGPSWLSSTKSDWPSSDLSTISIENLPELKPALSTALHTTSNEPSSFDVLSKFSSWTKVTHVIAYVLRFIKNCKSKITLKATLNRRTSLQVQDISKVSRLSLQEIDQASNQILQTVQNEVFQNDLVKLKKRQTTSTPALQKLSPFLDSNGLIRVGGRLSNSNLQFNAKHPILLPKKHHITKLLIDHYHVKYLHCGPQQLQSILSQKYWILSARSIIRSRIYHCIRCFKCRPRINPPQMADLPRNRVSPAKVFNNSAVDFAGPFNVKLHKARRLQHIKVYLCLFICLSTKAVHLEMVTDLTADAFTASLTRFISRRGVVSHLYSDNATNFVGTARELKRVINQIIQQDSTQCFMSQNCITFHFIPPRAPHFGGLWERAIQSAKNHMRRTIGDQILTIEEFITLCCRVEAMLNSRPLTPMSSDPRELNVLTPGHFITGEPLVTLPELDKTEVPMNRLSRWQLVQSFAQQIWKRWQKEYLHTLQHRPKWTKPNKNLRKDDLVLIHEDNKPPLHWSIGRVNKVIYGQDNIVRVAEVFTSSGFITRPVNKLSVLPLDDY